MMADYGGHLPETDNGTSAIPVVVLNRDLMFGVQIANVVRALGFTPGSLAPLRSSSRRWVMASPGQSIASST
jgi:hypothetical protein